MRTTPPSISSFAIGALAAVLVALPGPAAAQPEPGSAPVTRWTLDNGLRVVVEDVPAARGIAVTLGYPWGSERDPADTEGLAALLAEVAFASPAGDLPQRRREEMPSLRPLGWAIKVTPRFTLLTEVVPPDHLSGLLYELSLRLRERSVTRASLQEAVASVTVDLQRRHGGDLAWTLRQGARDAVSGVPGRQAPKRGTGIERLKPEDVQQRLATAMAPAGMVLTIAGPLGQQAVEDLTRDLFDALPAGTPPGAFAAAPPQPDSAAIEMPGIERSRGVFGIIAPALDNPSHPEFYLHAVLLGAICSTTWGAPVAPMGAWFEYAVLDEPDLMRIYPPIPGDTRDPAVLEGAVDDVLRGLLPNTVPPGNVQSVKDGVMWLLGGPLPGDLARAVGRTPGIVHQIGASLAARELLGGEAFWAGYRARLARVSLDTRAWRTYFGLPEHQVRVLVTPAGAR